MYNSDIKIVISISFLVKIYYTISNYNFGRSYERLKNKTN